MDSVENRPFAFPSVVVCNVEGNDWDVWRVVEVTTTDVDETAVACN